MFGNHRLYRRLLSRAVEANSNMATEVGSGTRLLLEMEVLVTELLEILFPSTERIHGMFVEILVA